MSGQQTPAQARVIDPILSQHARGYRQAGLIARMLFPIAYVAAYGGQVIQFGKESFRQYSSKRAPGTATKRIRFGYSGAPYAVVPRALEAVVPRELGVDAAAVPGINLGSRAVNTVMRVLDLEHEVECAGIATNASNYDTDHKITLTSTDRWSHPSSSDPVDDVMTGREAIRASIGMYPNTMMISAKALRCLKNHDDLIGRTSNAALRKVTLDTLREVFEVDNIVVGAATVADDADALSDVWGADVVLAYAAAGSDAGANNEEPAYGYTYAIEGMPLVEVPYWDNSTKSWVYGVSSDMTPVLSGMTAAYLIKDAGLPHA
jgi:hypothetical protein